MNFGMRRNSLHVPVVISEVEILLANRGEASPRWLLSRHTHVWQPPTDLYETEDHFVVQVEIAGMGHADFNVLLNGRQLSIGGFRQASTERRAYYQMEVHFGEFRSDLELPGPVALEGVDATYRDGFLRVVLPKLKGHLAAR